MSVIVSKRGKQKFGVYLKSVDLAAYTIKACLSEKRFPKKYRWILTKEIASEAIHAAVCVRKANSLDLRLKSLHEDRLRFQKEANVSFETLLTLIDIAYTILKFPSSTLEYWTGLVIDAEEALAAWVDSDRDRIRALR